MIFVSPSMACPPDLGVATHELANGAAMDGAVTWGKLAGEPRWVDIYLPLKRCS